MDWARGVATQPRGELTRWQRTARYAFDLGRAGAKQLGQNRAPQMGAALAFRTLFGLLPVLVVATVVVRAWMGPETFKAEVNSLIRSLGLHEIGPEGPADAATSGGSLGGVFETLVNQAGNIQLAAVGWIGLAVLIYSAISLMVTIENSFNTIFGSPHGRPWIRRVPLYWFVLTVGPLVIGATFFVDARFGSWIGHVDAWQWLLVGIKMFWTFSLTWLLLFAVFTLVPNARPSVRAALIGSFVSAVLLGLGKKSLGVYLENAMSMQQLYGSLGLVPLFMFWVYLMWLVVLFGVEISALLQQLGDRPIEEIKQQRPPSGVVDPAAVLTVMQVAAEDFAAGLPTVPQRVSDSTCLPEPTVRLMLDRLIEGGFLHRLERGDGAVVLARPAEQIGADQLMDLGFSLVDEAGVGRRPALMDRLREAQKAVAAKLTLAAVASNPRGARFLP
jgi:membrane protein